MVLIQWHRQTNVRKMLKYKAVNPQLHSYWSITGTFTHFLACTISLKTVNIHQLLNTVMTPKISKHLFYAFSPALSFFEWVVIKHMYMLSIPALCLQCSCIGYLQKTSHDVLRNSNDSVRDAQYSSWGSTSLYETTARKPLSDCFLFSSVKKQGMIWQHKNVRFIQTCNWGWILQLLVDGYI